MRLNKKRKIKKGNRGEKNVYKNNRIPNKMEAV
jgi:hypothetical protein